MIQIYKDLISGFAEDVADQVAAQAQKWLQQSTVTFSEEESGLNNTWDEICVQVRGEASFSWEDYETVMSEAVLAELQTCGTHELVALWMQTDPGRDWYWERDKLTDEEQLEITRAPYQLDDIAMYIMNKCLLPMAGSFTNDAIERYLNKEYSDEEGAGNDEIRVHLVELMPMDTMVTDLWDWDIHFEDESFDDLTEAAFADSDALIEYANDLADNVLTLIEDHELDYNQPGWETAEDFEEWVRQECHHFMSKWRQNVKTEYGY